MRMRDALALLSVAALAACGGKPAGLVKMMGLTPNTSLQKDNREIRCYCPSCGKQVEADVRSCPQKDCKASLSWKEDYPCGYCSGTGVCQACYLMEKEGGKCFNCKGDGYITFQGRTPACADCKGKKNCTICGGSQKCDFCGGSQRVAKEVIKAKAKKPAEGEGEEKVTPVEKKAEAPKPPAEEKKAEAPKEEKKADEPKPAEEKK